MTETPKCPYCGAGLEVTHVFVSNAAAAHKMVYTCFCRECGIYTVEPENRPLTLEEVEAHCEDGVAATPLWVEFKNVPDVSRWMCAEVPGYVFSIETINIFLRSCGEKYGRTCRCWPRKPTPEQMAAAKWEE